MRKDLNRTPVPGHRGAERRQPPPEGLTGSCSRHWTWKGGRGGEGASTEAEGTAQAQYSDKKDNVSYGKQPYSTQ